MKMHRDIKRAPRSDAAELEQIRAEIAALLAEREALEASPDQVEQKRRLRAVTEQILLAETGEEALIRSMEAQGRSVLRRPDAAPAVVLAP
jgi:hypothetical protein